MFTVLVALSLPAAQPSPTHEAENPLYKGLLETGLSVGTDLRAKLPAPSMADGLDAARQKAVITAVIGDTPFDEFTRKSIVGPQVLRIGDAKPSDPKAPARTVDLWFVAYGDFKSLDDEKFRDRLVAVGRGDGKGVALTKEDLAKRKITPGDDKRERFGSIEFDFLDKVRIKATGRAVWSRTTDSMLVAAEIDQRFLGDAEFPNQWRSLTKEGGEPKVGGANPWGGAAFYLKITKLAEPAGALFIEQHVVFTEPTGWFDGANLLRSKLPLVMQDNVRTMRREWLKGGK